MDHTNRPNKPADDRPGRVSPIILAFGAMALVNIALAYLAFGGHSPSVGGDVAGNAMSTAFEKLFMIAALGLVGFLAVLFLLIRKQGFRIALIVILALNSFLLLTIL
jgi:hypothetical protein